MNQILLIGLNYQTAPVELRECLAFSVEEAEAALNKFIAAEAVEESMVISTCNRVEIVMTAQDRSAAISLAKNHFSLTKQMPISSFDNSLYVLEGADAVRHVFRVTASLDSMMVGEPQILGQVKEAYRVATQKKTTGVILNRLLHRAFFVAKRVRSETGIGDHAVSISYAAIELGRKIFGNLEGKSALLVGAGEMAELAVEHLKRNKIKSIYVANRTFSTGVALAERFDGQAIRFEEIESAISQADIVITSTGSPDFVIMPDQVKRALKRRKHRPVFFIDIAVPRDIHPEVNRLDNAYLYDIDDLTGVIEDNIEDRKKEAIKAERLVDEAVLRFQQWCENLDIVPTIVALREKFEAIAQAEKEKTFHALNHLNTEDRKAIDRMAVAMINKFLHDPTMLLKSNDSHWNKSACLDFTRKLFRLDD